MEINLAICLIATSALALVLGVLSFMNVVPSKYRDGLRFILGYDIVLSALFFICIAVKLPPTVPVVFVSALSPMIISALPYFTMKLNPELLLDFEKFTPPRENVRRSYEYGSGSFSNKSIENTYNRALFSYKVAVNALIISSVLCVMALLDIEQNHGLFCYYPLLLAIIYALISRKVASNSQKSIVQITSVLFVLVFMMFADCPSLYKLVIGITVAIVSLLLILIAVNIKEDSYSLTISRFGDIVEFIAVVAAIPYAFVSTDLIDVFRNVVI